MNRRLAFFGHVNIDIILVTPEIHSHGSSEVTAVREQWGGTAGNFAIVASRLGVSFDIYGAVSRSTHGRYLDYLQSLGIDLSTLNISDDTVGPVCYVITNRSDQLYYMHQGPMGNWKPSVSDLKKTDYDVVHFSTGPLDRYATIAKNVNSSITFDPGQEINYRYSRDDIESMLELSRIMILNDYEMSLMTKILGKTQDEVIGSCKSVIVTEGKRGVTIYDNGEIMHVNSIPVEYVKDTVGAGDSFRAGLYFGLQRNYNLFDSVMFGQISASRSIATGIMDFDLNADKMLAEFEKNAK
jgi:sugar/nucleoside kinase (ribokinase family)